MGSARTADEWFVLSEQTIKSADPSVAIKSAGGRWDKDVKQVKISVEGADVEITTLVLSWDNRRDDTLKDVGVLKSGGQTAPKDAPGRKGRLTSVTVQYKILNNAPTATLWSGDLTERAVTRPEQAPTAARPHLFWIVGKFCSVSCWRFGAIGPFPGGALAIVLSIVLVGFTKRLTPGRPRNGNLPRRQCHTRAGDGSPADSPRVRRQVAGRSWLCLCHGRDWPSSGPPAGSRTGGGFDDFFRRFTLLVCAPAFSADDLEGLRVQQITTEVEKLGFQVVRARRVEDAEIAVQTDAAIGCVLVDWGKGGLEGKTTALINLMRRRGLEMPIVILVRRKRFEDIPVAIMDFIDGYVFLAEEPPEFIAKSLVSRRSNTPRR
jgi:hypothetical protein